MPRTAITPQVATSAGLTLATEAANALGHSVVSDPKRTLIVTTVGTATVVTLQTPGTVDGNAVADKTISIGTNATRYIAIGHAGYRQDDGTVLVDLSAVTAVTVAVLESGS